MNPTKLYFLVGFLGSGKTTLLQYLLSVYQTKRIGIIVNDFGSESVDEKRFPDTQIEKEGIHNGSVFCTCRSDQLVEAIVDMSTLQLDIIFVEASGLANPGSMIQIVRIIEEQVLHPTIYSGCIGVVDGSSLHKIQSTNIVKNQILFSDIVLLNKIDLIDETIYNEAVQSITKIHSKCMIIPTEHAVFDVSILDDLIPSRVRKIHHGMMLQKQSYALDISSLSEETVQTLYHTLKNEVYRIKGFIKTKKGILYLDCVDGECSTQELSTAVEPTLVFLTIDPIDLENLITTTLSNIQS